MKRLQILVPEETYERIRLEAKRREWTVAEVVRRGLEKQLESAVEGAAPAPGILTANLGAPKLPDSEWRELANDRGLDALS